MSQPSTQLDAFLRQIPTGMESIVLPAGSPRTVFPSALQLSLEQEERLVAHCMSEIAKLESEMGRTVVNNAGWWRTQGGSSDNQEQDPMASFFGKREKWHMIYAMELEWRQHSLPIWAESNIHIPLTHRIVKQQISRAQGYFFGTDPWFTISPAGANDDETARILDNWTKWAFHKSRVRPILEQAIQFAFIRGESIVKSTWRTEVDYYQTYAEVAIDLDGRPLVAEDDDYIYPEDEWIYDETGEMRVLKRSPETGLPDWADGDEANLEFDTLLIDKADTRYKGLDLAIPNYKDVLISPLARDIESAPFIAHLYSRPAIDVAGEYMDHLRRSGNANEMPRIIELLRSQAGGPRQNWTAELAPRAELGEASFAPGYGSGTMTSAAGAASIEPSMEIVECYLHYDALGLGRTQNIVVMIDKANQRPIFYDYLKNYAPSRPFHVIRVNPVDNRWHGQSAVEDCWQINANIDLQFNRINLSNQRSGNFYELDPDVYRDFENTPNPVGLGINGGRVYTRKPNMIGREGFKVTPIVEVKAGELQQMIEFLSQVLTNMSGVSSSNDAQMAGLETSDLATGIRHLERSNQEQFAPFISQLSEGIEIAARAGVNLLLLNMDEEETYRFLDGDTMKAAVIEKTKVSNFDFDLKLEISRFRAEQQSQQNMAAIALLKDYAAQMPEIKPALRPLALRQLQLFETPNAEMALQILDAVMPTMPTGAPLGEQAPVTSPERAVEPTV